VGRLWAIYPGRLAGVFSLVFLNDPGDILMLKYAASGPGGRLYQVRLRGVCRLNKPPGDPGRGVTYELKGVPLFIRRSVVSSRNFLRYMCIRKPISTICYLPCLP